MDSVSHVPPGFRFHPTDEELVDYYLRKKISSRRIDLDVIRDIDLYKIEPWDLQEKCKIGTEEQNEWYFFSHKDKKYPTGTRTNRATTAGFWKATGRDKPIYSKHNLIGMRKTLVFYKGRAPNGQKSDWIMHEYRLETNENGTPQEEGWVVCRVFKKRITSIRKASELESPCWYDEQVSFMPELDSPKRLTQPNMHHFYLPYPCKQELGIHYHMPNEPYGIDVNHGGSALQSSSLTQEEQQQNQQSQIDSIYNYEQVVDQVTDWRVLDKFVASQLSHEDVSKEPDFNNGSTGFRISDETNLLLQQPIKQQESPEYPSTSSSNRQIDLWK